MKRFSMTKLFFLLLALAAAGVCAAWFMRDKSTTEYQTAPVEQGDLESTISATGLCNAVVTVLVGSQVSGNIKQLYADFNTQVTKGQTVALIDPEPLKAKVAQARANFMASQAAEENALAQKSRALADLGGAKANLTAAEANVERNRVAVRDAKIKFDRIKGLADKKLLAQDDLDTAQATFDTAEATLRASEAQVESVRSAVGSVKAQVGVTDALIKSAQAQQAQTQAVLDQAEIDLTHTEIQAPVDGTVIARRMDVGQTVAASFSAPTLFEIAQDLKQMQVNASIDEADVGRVRADQDARFTVDAYPGETFHGKVTQIRKAPINVQNVVTYDVIIKVANPDLKLFPGMTANIRILIDRREDVVKVPNAALRVKIDQPGAAPATAAAATPRPAGGGGGDGGAGGGGRAGRGGRGAGAQGPATVYVLEPGGKPRKVTIKLGISDGAFTEVTEGELKKGEPVIVSVLTTNKPAAAGQGTNPFAPASSSGPGSGSRRPRL